MRASTSGMLDRALDVAAALEVRGYGAARRPGRTGRAGTGHRGPLSRHDLAFAASAVAVAAIATLARWVPLAPFSAYPSLRAPAGPEVLGAAAALLACALAPFLDRRGL
jgi:energy-coupling factor transport system permease protein